MNPVRTCIGCREREGRTELVRLVLVGTSVVVDRTASRPGRGAWLHPNIVCFDRAKKRRAFARAFRVRYPLDTHNLENRLNG